MKGALKPRLARLALHKTPSFSNDRVYAILTLRREGSTSALSSPISSFSTDALLSINFIGNPPPDLSKVQYSKPWKGKGKMHEDDEEPKNVSDREWELRIGEPKNQTRRSGRISISLLVPWPGRAIFVLQRTLPDFFSTGLVMTSSITPGEPGEPIYSKSIRLTYMPPVRLPAPFPKTLHIEGAFFSATSEDA